MRAQPSRADAIGETGFALRLRAHRHCLNWLTLSPWLVLALFAQGIGVPSFGWIRNITQVPNARRRNFGVHANWEGV